MNKRNTVRRFFGEMTGRYKISLLFVLVFIVTGTLANISGSFFIERIIDGHIPALIKQDAPDFTPLINTLALMGVIYLTGVIATYLYNRIMVSISQGVQKSIREKMFAHMQTLPIRYFDTHTHGNVMSRYTNDIDTLREFFSHSLPQLISSVITILSVTGAMLMLSPALMLIVFIFVAISLFVSKKLSFKAARLFMRQQQSIGELNGYIKEMISGQKVIKVFCHEQAVIDGFDEKNEVLRGYGKKANQFSNILMPVIMNIGAMQYVAIALAGGFLALHDIGGVTLGVIAAFLTLSKTFSAPIGQISVQVNAVAMALAGSARIFELLDEEPETDAGNVALVNAKYQDGELVKTEERTGIWAWEYPRKDGTVSYIKLEGAVEFSDVDFSYNMDKLVLKDISLTARPGEKIAFVGATGAGKTTITNLINRFYDIADGKIRYDGININKIKKADLRRSLGIVLQDTRLFTGTIADNIRYGKPDATDEEIRRAAVVANADDFIRRLPDGYNTYLTGDGGNLSGGQRQLIAIARAAVADPSVMILDEATSSIDTRTEQIIQKGMDALMEGRTVFVIAHRLSTVKNADAIMVLEEGRIIESGNHSELLEKKGRYYQLYTGRLKEQ
ncbi:MAG: ABC transporter ATP-binding protein [Clostridiales bacterium]|nr:ABC transporter ATP-binding protein [Clostridiales bacterium]